MPVRKRRQKSLRVSDFAFYWSFSSDIMAVKGSITSWRLTADNSISWFLWISSASWRASCWWHETKAIPVKNNNNDNYRWPNSKLKTRKHKIITFQCQYSQVKERTRRANQCSVLGRYSPLHPPLLFCDTVLLNVVLLCCNVLYWFYISSKYKTKAKIQKHDFRFGNNPPEKDTFKYRSIILPHPSHSLRVVYEWLERSGSARKPRIALQLRLWST